MDYTPLRINTIRPETIINFDLYILFKEQYLRYKSNGITIEIDLHKKLKKQKVARFFITADDEVKYQKYLDQILNETLKDDSVPIEEKATLAEGVASTAVDKMISNPGSKAAFQMTEKAAVNLRQVLTDNKDALKLIFGKDISEGENIIVKHSLNVSVLATKLAQYLGRPEHEIDNIAVAGLIHDLSLTRLSSDKQQIFKKEKSNLSRDELKLYNAHPRDTVELLKDKDYINKEIIALILNHEENRSGSGPHKKLKLTITEEILAIVDCYDKKITGLGKSPKDALKEMTIDELGNYDLKLINKLKSVLKQEGVI